ncbi:MAG TPA: TonB-dependent receptor [Gemmatimonadaceae bacterium]|nr:TonB-dependent receptor [Gemmatimonadaceae bacterium]
MVRTILALALAASPAVLLAQQSRQHADTTARTDTTQQDVHSLSAVNIVAAPIDRAQPLNVTHVSASMISNLPVNSTWDLLRQAAGIEVHQQGQGPGFASDASLRGFSSDHSTDIALWVDGVPVNEPINGHAEGYNDFSEIFSGAVQDIDVIRGPTSPLFGNFAMGGVVNVHTVDRMDGSEATARVGTYGRVEGTIMTGFDHGIRGGGVFGVHYEHGDGFRPNAGHDLLQAHARVVHELAHGWSVDAGTELYGAGWNSPGFLGGGEFAQHQYDIVSNPSDGGFKRRAQERVSLQHRSGSRRWRTTAYGTQGRWQLYLTIPPAGGRFEGTGSQTEEEDARYGVGLTSALTWELPKGEVTVGTQDRWNHAHYENYFTTDRSRDSVNALIRARQGSAALFLASHANLSSRLRLDVGARADLFGTTSQLPLAGRLTGGTGVFSPKLGASYRLGAGWSAYADWARGFRSTDGVIDDPSLPLITAWDYEGGFKLNRAGVSGTATLFRMDVSNEQTYNPLSGESNNGGSSRRQGLEVSWSALVSPAVFWTGNWTFNDARYTHLTIVAEDNSVPTTVDGARVYNTAKYVGTSAVRLAPATSPVTITIGGNWVGPYSPFDEPGVVLGAYGLMHVSASFPIGGAHLAIGIRNLLDRAYPELVAGGLVSPGEPRTVFVQVRRGF